jgi:pterin-4a-carbinolamine dehydratase
MKQHKSLTEMFANLLNEDNNRMPIKVSIKSSVPLLPSIDKWHYLNTEKTSITKKYVFLSKETRNEFIFLTLDTEQETTHKITLFIENDAVSVTTGSETHVSEIDKEIARELDSHYKQVQFSSTEIR